MPPASSLQPRILALETTDKSANLAVWNGPQLLGESFPQGRSAQSLAPAMQELLRQVGWASRDVQCVAVGIGPGSFTGLRIGLATAKMFAYATGAKLIGVDTLEAIAMAAIPQNAAYTLSVAVDVQRSEVVAQNFLIFPDTNRPKPLGEKRILPVDQWWNFGRNDDEQKTYFSGPILHRLAARIPADVRLLDASLWNPRASQIGRIALDRYETGLFDDLWTLQPYYSRKSAAEERKEQKENTNNEPRPAGAE